MPKPWNALLQVAYNIFNGSSLPYDLAFWAQNGVYPNTGFYYPIPANYHHGLTDIAQAQARILDGRLNPQAHFASVQQLLTNTVPVDCHVVNCTVPVDVVNGSLPPLNVSKPCLDKHMAD